MSNGLGRYSKAPRSAARTAVSSVFCALITITGRSGRSMRMRGSRSRLFSSGNHVGDHHVALAGADPAPEGARHAGRLDLVTLPRQARLTTVRIAASSSASRIFSPLMRPPAAGPAAPAAGGRQQHPEGGRRLAGQSSHAAMVGHDLGHQRQAEAAAAALRADERLEQMVDQMSADPWSVVAHLDRDRQLRGGRGCCHGDAQPVLVLGGDGDLAARRAARPRRRS